VDGRSKAIVVDTRFGVAPVKVECNSTASTTTTIPGTATNTTVLLLPHTTSTLLLLLLRLLLQQCGITTVNDRFHRVKDETAAPINDNTNDIILLAASELVPTPKHYYIDI